MKLISCRIENFGTLSGASIEFDSGLSAILEDNGRGKSTLAAFIRAIFYGLPSTRSSNLSQNDRKKYAPWNNGAFGGELTFENNGRIIRIERFFGKKNAGEDTLFITDTVTGKPCKDFGDEPGQTLFGINSAAWSRSTFITCEGGGKDDGLQSITARLNGIIDPEDIVNYDRAIKALSEKRKYLSVTDGGRIGQAENEIAILEKRLSERQLRENELQNNIPVLNSLKNDAAELMKERDTLDKKRTALISAGAERLKRSQYTSLLAAKRENAQKAAELKRFFANHLPKERELKEQEAALVEINLLEQDIKLSESSICKSADRTLEYFKGELPDRAELTDCIYTYKKSLADYSAAPPFDSERLEALEAQCAENNHAAEEKDAADRVFKAGRQQKRFKLLCLSAFICCFILLGLGMILAATAVSLLLGVTLTLISAAGILICAFIYFKGYMSANADNTRASDELEKQSLYRQRLSEYLTLLEEKKKYDALSEAVKKSEEHALALSAKLGLPGGIAGLEDAKERLDEYASIARAAEAHRKTASEALERQIKLTDMLTSFLSAFDTGELTDAKALAAVRQKLTALSTAESMEREADLAFERFTAANPGMDESAADTGINAESDPDSGELNDKLAEVSDKLKSTLSAITRYETVNEKSTELIEAEAGIEEELARLNEAKDALEYRLKVIKATVDYLGQAKEKLSGRYTGKVRSGFLYYSGLLANGLFEDGELDTELTAKLRGGGTMRELGYFSRGTRDLVDICVRLALCDALDSAESTSEQKHGFILMDDPFVNLDKKRLEKALAFIGDISKERQIIYLTCHPGRMPQA